MNRRGLFGALLSGIAGATGVRGRIGLPVQRVGRWVVARQGAVSFDSVAGADVQADRVVMLKTSAMGKSELAMHLFKDAVDLPGKAPWRAPNAGWLAEMPGAYVPPAPEAQLGSVPPWVIGRDLPEIWPGRAAEIIATAALPPLAQVERLVELFGASGEADAPAFADLLIGELVLTRMRLAASSDPRTRDAAAS